MSSDDASDKTKEILRLIKDSAQRVSFNALMALRYGNGRPFRHLKRCPFK